LTEMGGLVQEHVDKIIQQAEAKAAEAEAAAAEQRRKQREQERLAAAENVDEGLPSYLADQVEEEKAESVDKPPQEGEPPKGP